MSEMMDQAFFQENMMGPNAVRILEEMCGFLPSPLKGKILDLGCGRGLTSLALAQRFDAEIFAVDLWICATENYRRFQQFSFGENIVPIHADVHDLPFAEGYFDGVVTVDSYHYYGAEEGFLGKTIVPLVKPGGLIAMAVPGLQKDLKKEEIPPELLPYWQEDMNFHSCGWWKQLWEKEPAVKVIQCRPLDCHGQAWKDWLACDGNPYARGDVPMIQAEGGRYFNTVFLLAQVV